MVQCSWQGDGRVKNFDPVVIWTKKRKNKAGIYTKNHDMPFYVMNQKKIYIYFIYNAPAQEM